MTRPGRRSRTWVLLDTPLPLPLLLAACGSSPEPTSPLTDTPAPTADTGREACGTEPPWFDHLAVVPTTDDEGPRLVFHLVPFDPDGALHFMSLRVWHDLSVDAEVDVAGEPTWSIDLDILNAESMAPNFPEVCEVDGGFPMSVAMRVEEADGIPFGSPVEVAVVIVDADGLVSEPVLGHACLDAAAGEPGCP